MDSWGELEEKPPLERIRIAGVEIQPGDQVILRPLRGADIMDLALAGKTATVESILQDYEDRVYLAVTVDDDPGQDLGKLRQPGHRFFFSPFEIEPLGSRGPERPGKSAARLFFTRQAAGGRGGGR